MITIILNQEADQFDFDEDFISTPEINMEMTFTEGSTWPDIVKGLFKTLKLAGYPFNKESIIEHLTELDDMDF